MNTYTIQADISGLRPDRIRRISSLQLAHDMAAAVLAANPDRDVRVTITCKGQIVFVRDRKVSFLKGTVARLAA